MSTPAVTPAPELLLKYPLGKFARPAEFTPEVRRQSIAVLTALPTQLRAAVQGLDQAQLDTPYREGGWTVRQLVHHMADSHMNAYVRFKLALTEDWPVIKPYKEALWAELADSQKPIESSLSLTAALHERWAALAESLSEEDWQRGFVHPEHDRRQTLEHALVMYDWHSRHHTAHITELRRREGW
jgi:uncharacterized damage-inducible protein DinB